MKKWGMDYFTEKEAWFNVMFFRDTIAKVDKTV